MSACALSYIVMEPVPVEKPLMVKGTFFRVFSGQTGALELKIVFDG